MSWHAPNGVDQLIVPLLPPFGYAVDVGANNGVFQSNTLALEESGWIVLCVEPNPLLAEAGRKARRLWRQVACSDVDSDNAEFVSCGDEPFASSSSLAPQRHTFPGASKSFIVKTRTLDRVLHEAGFPRLDLLSIDVEGYEPEVLRGIDLGIWRPKIIVAESFQYDLPAPDGYTLMNRLEFDNVFVRE